MSEPSIQLRGMEESTPVLAFPVAGETWSECGTSFGTVGITPTRAESLFTREQMGRDTRRIRVLRRLRGLVLEVGTEDVRVLLIDDEDSVEYWLPAGPLRKARITERHQPFEMDEFETTDDDGSYGTGYRYRPLAEADAVFSDALDIDAEHRRRLGVILQKLGNAET